MKTYSNHPNPTHANRYIPPEHFDRILRASTAEDRALWILASETGFRIDDILQIRLYQTRSPSLTLKESKTGNTRAVLLTDRAVLALSVLRNNCPSTHQFAYLFPTRLKRKKNKLHRSTVHRHFLTAVDRAGLSGNGYTVHSLRKIYARNLYEKTHSVLAVQRDLGHAVTATTMLYINDLQM